jgi:hypothetical protein
MDEELVAVTAAGRAEEKVDGKAEEKVDGLVYSWGEGWAADSVEESGLRPTLAMVAEMVGVRVRVRVVGRVWVTVWVRAGETV